MDRLRFGPAGIPLCCKKNELIEGLKTTSQLSLDAFEIEFVRGININFNKIPEIKKIAKELDIVLTAHAPYYINLNAKEETKIKKSIERILKTAEILNKLDGFSVVFHPGYYLKEDPAKVFNKIKEQFKKIEKKALEEGLKVDIRPEIMGRVSCFGSLEEILKICEGFEIIKPAIDFAHLHARTSAYNTVQEFKEVLGKIENVLGKEELNNMHIHISGIEYDKKGEKKHLPLEKSDLKWKELIKTIKEFKVKGIIISESPILEEDAIRMKNYYNSIK